MKKLFTLFSLVLCLFATAQENVEYMYIHRSNNVVERILVSDIDSVTFVDPSSPESPDTPDTPGSSGSGLYLGVMGFNQQLYSYSIRELTADTKSCFDSFIDGLVMKSGTLLYYSVDKAINTLQFTQLPDDLSTVAIVTFTDGLDQGSMMMNSSYSDNTEYLNAINSRIKNESVSGLPITAYSIGLRGTDVTDVTTFRNNLKKLASSDSNAIEVASMSEVNANFKEIAGQLSKNNYIQTINLTIPGVSNGTVIRFTFDNVSSATKSSLYIEGTFNLAARSLENVKYVGLSSSSGTNIKGVQDGIFVSFTFNDVHSDNNGPIDKQSVDEWTYISSNGTWQVNSEFDKAENTDIVTERSSAAIMLVLDCSSSLSSDFAKAQSNAKDFINTLYSTVSEDNTPSVSGSTRTFTVNGVSFNMISVDGGTFDMGATAEQVSYSDSDEKPVHSVTLSSYHIGETEVTQELWQAVMGSNPSSFTGNLQHPVVLVNWNNCQTFIQKLNELTGENFKLPTEAQWEYAARGGNKSQGYLYSGSNTIGDVAWYYSNSSNIIHPVKGRSPNELGLYDMSGNVWEWCSDWYGSSYYSSSPQNDPAGPSSGSSRVLRGGSWSSNAEGCRVAYRNSNYPDSWDNVYGLRLAL